ncbi:hypothetical protein ACQKWADRAFT_297669 [Trichoderma austrokoningii]
MASVFHLHLHTKHATSMLFATLFSSLSLVLSSLTATARGQSYTETQGMKSPSRKHHVKFEASPPKITRLPVVFIRGYCPSLPCSS